MKFKELSKIVEATTAKDIYLTLVSSNDIKKAIKTSIGTIGFQLFVYDEDYKDFIKKVKKYNIKYSIDSKEKNYTYVTIMNPVTR